MQQTLLLYFCMYRAGYILYTARTKRNANKTDLHFWNYSS